MVWIKLSEYMVRNVYYHDIPPLRPYLQRQEMELRGQFPNHQHAAAAFSIRGGGGSGREQHGGLGGEEEGGCVFDVAVLGCHKTSVPRPAGDHHSNVFFQKERQIQHVYEYARGRKLMSISRRTSRMPLLMSLLLWPRGLEASSAPRPGERRRRWVPCSFWVCILSV